MSDQAPPADAPPAAPPAENAKKYLTPVSEIPLQWVKDEDTPEPYLINAADFDASKHTAIDERGNAVKKRAR